MLFSRVRGGADIEHPRKYEIKLHEATISYLLPSGFQGIPGSEYSVVNYRNKLKSFNQEVGGREYLSIDGASWDYYRVPFLGSLLPLSLDTIGTLSFRISVSKVPFKLDKCNLEHCAVQYAKLYLNGLLEGKDGLNTFRRKSSPNYSEEELAKILLKTPEKFNLIKLNGVEWVNFRLEGYPYRGNYTDYYIVLLNDNFSLNVEFQPQAGGAKESERKQVETTNQKAMEMIVNSMTLEFN